MWIAWMIFTLIAVVAVIIGCVFLFNVWRFTRIPLRHCSFLFIDRDAVPDEENSKLAEAEEFLLSEGFVYSCSIHLPQTQVDIPGQNEKYLNVYHHTESDAYALTYYTKELARYSVIYVSCFSDKTYWYTCNQFRHYLVGSHASHIFDDYLPDDAAAWRAHLKRIADSGKQPARDKDLAKQIIKEEETGLIDRLLKRGALKPTTEGRWRLTWFFAFRFALAVIIGTYRENSPPSSAPMEAEAFFRRKEITQDLSFGKKHKGKLFVVTGILFLLVFGWLLYWSAAFILFLVILIHELGHLLAMRAFGYKNTSILFLPGLGALTMGEKKNTSPFQRLIIYLAGPMPGIMLSGILMYVMMSTQLGHTLSSIFFVRWHVSTTVFFFFLINFINLLPVYPLDGGRVVEMLFFSRLPRGRLVFTFTGCLFFFLMAYLWHDRFSMIVGVLLAIGIPSQWRLTQVRLMMKTHEEEAQTEEEAAKMVFEALSHHRFSKWPLNKRLELADVLVTERMERKPNGWEILLGGIVYLLCLAIPLWLGFDVLRGVFGRG